MLSLAGYVDGKPGATAGVWSVQPGKDAGSPATSWPATAGPPAGQGGLEHPAQHHHHHHHDREEAWCSEPKIEQVDNEMEDVDEQAEDEAERDEDSPGDWNDVDQDKKPNNPWQSR